MAAYYEYLMASLPALQFGMKPPFSFERFIEVCRSQISEEDLRTVGRINGPLPYEEKTGQKTLDSWLDFEAALRNELVRIRASRKKVDPQRFLRRNGLSEPLLYHTALHAHRIPALLESERFLDTLRWHKLEELQRGHYFDLDALVVYALKLMILARWEQIQNLNKEQALGQVLAASS